MLPHTAPHRRHEAGRREARTSRPHAAPPAVQRYALSHGCCSGCQSRRRTVRKRISCGVYIRKTVVCMWLSLFYQYCGSKLHNTGASYSVLLSPYLSLTHTFFSLSTSLFLSPSLSFSPFLSLFLSLPISLCVYFPQAGSPSRERFVRECNHRGANAEYQRGSHCRLGGAEEVQHVRRIIERKYERLNWACGEVTMGEWTAVCLVINR